MEPDRDDWFVNRWPTDARVRRGLALFGAVVRRRRLHHGYSQRYLGQLCGLDQSVISRLENGKLYGLRWHRFAKVIDALDGLGLEPIDDRGPWPGPSGHAAHAHTDEARGPAFDAAHVHTA